MHVVVIVMGDVGRSPRMQYHAQSLLQAGHSVSLLGYTGEDLIPTLQQQQQQRLQVYRFSLPQLPTRLQSISILYFAWRLVTMMVYTFVYLQYIRLSSTPIDVILLQNPPAMPLLWVVYVFCQFCKLVNTLRFSRIRQYPVWIIDWHNLGYSMLPKDSLMQRVVKTFELYMAPLANGHLTVTRAMKDYIQDEMLNKGNDNADNISVLYDCPPSQFQSLSLSQQHDVLVKFNKALVLPSSWRDVYGVLDNNNTLFTCKNGNTVTSRPNRPAFLISSTSWTADEDFGILLEALVLLEQRIVHLRHNLHVVLAVTGKGPQKDYYLEQISRLVLSRIAIATLWLEPADYPKLVACADLGICLHTSTSGLDLPMKVLDYFGSGGVPVCAVDFACLEELVQDNVQGRVFKTSKQLFEQLWDLLSPLVDCGTTNESPTCHNFGKLKEYSNNLQNRPRWSENWTQNALPLIKKVVANNR